MRKTVFSAFLLLSVLSILTGCDDENSSSDSMNSSIEISSVVTNEEVEMEETSEVTATVITTQTEVTTTIETTTQIETTISTEELTTEEETESETEISSIYEMAYELKFKEYSLYYLIDTDEKIVRSFATNSNSVYYGEYNGSIDTKMDIYYPGEGLDFHEYIKEKKKGNDYYVLVVTENDPNFLYPAEFRKCDVEKAESVLNQEGYHDSNHWRY